MIELPDDPKELATLVVRNRKGVPGRDKETAEAAAEKLLDMFEEQEGEGVVKRKHINFIVVYGPNRNFKARAREALRKFR